MHPDSADSSFEELYLGYKNRFIHIAFTYLRDENAAKDVVNDSFMDYWERVENRPSDTTPAAYVLGIVKNKCLMQLRSQGRHRRATEEIYQDTQWILKRQIAVLEDFDLTKLIFSKEVESIFRKQIARLPRQTREVFLASRDDNLTYDQIAVKYGLTRRQVMRNMNNALTQLRDHLSDYLPASVILFLLER